MAYYGRWAPYVPVAQRRRNAAAEAKRLMKKGRALAPVEITGRAIASTFWGKAWCDNLEKYCDFDNRMPRGRTYARNGSIVDLQIGGGKITSLVSGSSLYEIVIKIDKMPAKDWQHLSTICSAKVTSLLDLMRGKLSSAVIGHLTDPQQGMFPKPNELKLACSCPDYARMCKHVAATLYGVGYRLDSQPELFFEMRGVDRTELVSQALSPQSTQDLIGDNQSSELVSEDLETIFGIDLQQSKADKRSPGATSSRKRITKKKVAVAKETTSSRKAAKGGNAKVKSPKRAKAAVTSKAKSVTKSARPRAAKKAPSKKAGKQRQRQRQEQRA